MSMASLVPHAEPKIHVLHWEDWDIFIYQPIHLCHFDIQAK